LRGRKLFPEKPQSDGVGELEFAKRGNQHGKFVALHPASVQHRVTRHLYLLISLSPYLSRRSPRCLLHCSTHGTPTLRPTFSRRSPLARRDCARHSRFAAFHRSSPARRSTLLD